MHPYGEVSWILMGTEHVLGQPTCCTRALGFASAHSMPLERP